jgi:uncharacterized protein (TIGR02271 family)
MTNAAGPDVYIGRRAVDPDGDKIGTVGQVYVNEETERPDWITVRTGLFGLRESFAPLAGSSFDGENLVLPFDKEVVKDAPDIADSSRLDEEDQQSLYDYYERFLVGTGHDNATGRRRTGAGFADASRGKVYDTSDPTAGDAMTRSEEQLRVGTDNVEAGRARLRKYVVTEQQTVQVPVSREEVRVEREPITAANRGKALSGPDISEDEHEIVLHEERPVVEKEAVPKERVRLGKETVKDQRSVTGQVRKEKIDVDESAAETRKRPQNR